MLASCAFCSLALESFDGSDERDRTQTSYHASGGEVGRVCNGAKAGLGTGAIERTREGTVNKDYEPAEDAPT